MNRPTCETCPFWHTNDPGHEFVNFGECRVHPPQFDPVSSQPDDDDSAAYHGYFPETEYDLWCGKHPQFSQWIHAQQVASFEDAVRTPPQQH